MLAYDGANMTQIDAGGILDIAMAGTSATLLARKWESAMLVNVDNDTLRRILDNPEAMAAVERIEGWRSLGDNIIETIINKSEQMNQAVFAFRRYEDASLRYTGIDSHEGLCRGCLRNGK